MFCLLLVFLLAVILGLTLNKLTFSVCKSHRCLVGKTAIVTGGNLGIGYETCLNLASRGCKVIIADIADSEKSRLNIIKQSNNPNVVCMKLDLGSFKSIREFAAEIHRKEERLDILVNNAGIVLEPKNALSEDGFNSIWQVNYLGPFLLTHLLVDLLKKSAPSRIVFTSSITAFWFKFDTSTMKTRAESALRTYGSTKVALLIASEIFSDKLKNSGVTSNTTHPGMVFGTHIVTDPLPWTLAILNIVLQPLMKNPWLGGQTTTYVAVSEDLDGVTGEFFGECEKRSKPSALSDRTLMETFWKHSEDYVKLSDSEKI